MILQVRIGRYIMSRNKQLLEVILPVLIGIFLGIISMTAIGKFNIITNRGRAFITERSFGLFKMDLAKNYSANDRLLVFYKERDNQLLELLFDDEKLFRINVSDEKGLKIAEMKYGISNVESFEGFDISGSSILYDDKFDGDIERSTDFIKDIVYYKVAL